MEEKAKKALSKRINAGGTRDKRVSWVDPELLTQGEQAALYREHYEQHQDYMKRQYKAHIKWREENAERHKQNSKEYYQKNREKIRSYAKRVRDLKKGTK